MMPRFTTPRPGGCAGVSHVCPARSSWPRPSCRRLAAALDAGRRRRRNVRRRHRHWRRRGRRLRDDQRCEHRGGRRRDTIFVCPGTYVEIQINITKAVTLQGSGAASTIIDGGGGTGLTAGGHAAHPHQHRQREGGRLHHPEPAAGARWRPGSASASRRSRARRSPTRSPTTRWGTFNPAYGSDYGVTPTARARSRPSSSSTTPSRDGLEPDPDRASRRPDRRQLQHLRPRRALGRHLGLLQHEPQRHGGDVAAEGQQQRRQHGERSGAVHLGRTRARASCSTAPSPARPSDASPTSRSAATRSTASRASGAAS